MLPLPAGREASSGVGALPYVRHCRERTLLGSSGLELKLGRRFSALTTNSTQLRSSLNIEVRNVDSQSPFPIFFDPHHNVFPWHRFAARRFHCEGPVRVRHVVGL